MELKDTKKLENLVRIEERLHERQFNELLKFYEKNQDLICDKITTNGQISGQESEVFRGCEINESKLKYKKFYPYPGIALALKESVDGQSTPVPNPCTFIFYIPKTKKFISVKNFIERNRDILNIKYFGFKEMTKEEVKPYFRFYKNAGAFLGHNSKPMNSIKYLAYKFKSPWQKK